MKLTKHVIYWCCFITFANTTITLLTPFLREQNWTLTPLFFNIRYWLQTEFFSLWWNKGWRCISIFWSNYLRKHLLSNYFFKTYDKSSHNSDTTVLILFLSQLDQRLSIQSLQLRLKSANKEKTAFISSITTVLVYLYLKRLFVIKT